jgi:hypothetical protein
VNEVIVTELGLESSVAVVTRLPAVLPRNWGSFPGKAQETSLLHSIYSNSGAHRTSYFIGTGAKAAGSFNLMPRWTVRGSILPLSHMSSRHGYLTRLMPAFFQML